MKRIFTSIIATAVALLLCTGLATGQSLKVAGKNVTATGNVTGSGISGAVHYDAASRTLTLTDATIKTTANGIEVSGTGTITVKTIGKCEITSTQNVAVLLNANNAAFVFVVADKLTVNGYSAAVSGKERTGSNRNVTFKSASGALGQVAVKGDTYGFLFAGVTLENVLMRCEALMGCFTECSALTLTNCIVTEPAGAAVSGSNVKLSNGDVATSLLIEPEQYPIRIAGNYITPQNRGNVTGSGINGGTITFDPETRTLLLDNAQVERISVQALWNEMDNLTIALRGHSKLVSPNGTSIPVRIDKFTHITAAEGEDNPILEATNGGKAGAMGYSAVWVHATTIISNCELRAYGAGGIMGQGADSLMLDNATLRAASIGTPTSQAERRVMLSLFHIKKLVLRGSNFTGPAEVWYREGSPTYEGQTYTGFATTGTGNTPTRDTVVIQPCYPVMVGGRYVLKAEADNIRHGVTAGKVSYNPATKTLTLDGATITAGKGIGDQFACTMDIGVGTLESDTLRIALKGVNSITYDGTNIISYGAVGSKVVEIVGTANDWLKVKDGLVQAGKDLILRGCNVEIDNTLYIECFGA